MPSSESAEDPDLPLVRALQDGDPKALDALMERHGPRILHFILRSVADRSDAEDLAQETFVRAYLHIGKFHPRALFSTWLFRIALNLCRDHVRSRAFRQARVTDSLAPAPGDDRVHERDLSSSQADPAEEMLRRERLDALRRALALLPHGLKAPLLLTALDGLSHHQAAALLGLTAKAVETKIHRARQWLRTHLGPSGP